MLKRTMMISSFLTIFFLLSMLINLIILEKSDYESYRDFLDQGVKTISKNSLKYQPIQQSRKNVQKDIWLAQTDKRLHFRIKSSTSHLTISQKKGHLNFVENLERLSCWMQDSIETDDQQIRYFTAKKGIYTYPDQNFLAENTSISFYRLPGSSLPKSFTNYSPFLRGTADSVSFSLSKENSLFTAENFQAILFPKRGLR